MKRILATLLLTGLAAIAAPPTVPYKAKELTIKEASGKETLLSSYRGKVVVVALVSTTCQHCQHFVGVLNTLQKELAPRGFQPVGVAWNEGASKLVGQFVKDFSVAFPMGSTSIETVYSFIGAALTDRVMVPQILVVDRKGMVRAQTPVEGDPDLQDEAKLKTLLERLLK
jgi:peroxiredoxin